MSNPNPDPNPMSNPNPNPDPNPNPNPHPNPNPTPNPKQVFGLVKAHLKQFEAKNYTCVTGDNSVVLADDDDSKEEQALVQITSLFPELCQQLRLPYMVERRAEEIYSGWHKHGTRTALPQTIAAAAIWSASRQLAADLRETMGIELTMADLTRVAGVAEGTIMKMVSLP